MKVFWRDEPLSFEEVGLYDKVLKAHHESAFRGNISGQAVGMSAVGSGDYFKAIAAGLLTLGGAHGPIEETWDFLSSNSIVDRAQLMLIQGKKIPGWGNSFVKGEPDTIWTEFEDYLDVYFHPIFGKLALVTESLHEKGINIFPNPSAYTAAAAIALRIPKEISGYLLIAGRLQAWTVIAREHLKAK